MSCGIASTATTGLDDSINTSRVVYGNGFLQEDCVIGSPAYRRKIEAKMTDLSKRVAKGESNVAHLRTQVCILATRRLASWAIFAVCEPFFAL